MQCYKNIKKHIYITIYLCCSILGIKINANENNYKKIQWEIIGPSKLQNIDKSIRWEIIEEKDNKEIINNTANKNKIKKESKNSKHKLQQLGKAVPTANTLAKGDLILETSHVSTFNGGQSGGIGNQNYSGMIQYGFFENLTISTFYTEADDPLYKRIVKADFQPENLWSNYGIGLKWNLINENNYKLSIDSSIERWRVGSGGCFGYNCTDKSNNIFNSEITEVLNDNLISSLSIPITWTRFNDLNITLVPKFVYLPKRQGNDFGSGKFYGNNYGVGIGASYNLSKRIKSFYSSYIPIKSTNTFDNELNFKRTNLHTIGLNYELDSRSSLEGYITNSFGQTPATSVLTIPSSQDILYGGRFVYIPTNKIEKKANKIISENSIGNRVATTEIINQGKTYIYNGLNNNGAYFIKTKTGLSDNFSFNFSYEKIEKENNSSNKFINTYMKPRKGIIRGGGSALLFKEERGNFMTSGFSLSYGRLLGETRPGYLFAELLNSKMINKNIRYYINPKTALTGDGSLSSIGTSMNWKINNWISFIPEVNIGLSSNGSNNTFTIRKRINKNLNIDSYYSNSVSSVDMGQLLRSSGKYGINVGYKL